MKNYLWVLLVILPVWYFLMTYNDLHASLRMRPVRHIFASLAKVHVIGGVITSSAIYFLEPTGFSRGLIGLFILFSFFFLTVEKSILKGGLGFIRKRCYNFRNILIVGGDRKARYFIDLVEQHADWGLQVIGVLHMNNGVESEEIRGYRVLGRLEDLVETCKKNPVDEVVFCVPKELLPKVEEYFTPLEEMGITVRMVLDFFDFPRSRKEFSLFHGVMPILTFYGKAFDASQLFLKRCLDVFGGVLGLLIVAIFFPFIALAIKLESKGPVFFGQGRVGENGRLFICWKFRSMHVDAEEQKKDLMRKNEMNGAMFKIKDDPRITRVGRFLRKFSLDELPQFWNVLHGEMSLVGTRPPTWDEVEKYENWQRKRICIKPGITGLWQISGRNEVQDFDEVVKLDLKYIENWNLWLDVRILFKTVVVIFNGHGSY